MQKDGTQTFARKKVARIIIFTKLQDLAQLRLIASMAESLNLPLQLNLLLLLLQFLLFLLLFGGGIPGH